MTDTTEVEAFPPLIEWDLRLHLNAKPRTPECVLLDNLLPLGVSFSLHGPKSSGKSTLLRHAMLEAARNGYRCVWICYEDRNADNFAAAMLDVGATEDDFDNIKYLTPAHRGRLDFAALAAQVAEYEPHLVIVDSLTSMSRRHGKKNNDTEGADALDGFARELVNMTGATVGFIDHNSKYDPTSAGGTAEKGYDVDIEEE